MAGEAAPNEMTWRPAGSAVRRIARWLSERRAWIAAAVAPLAAGAIAFILIVPTVMPDVANWDTAEFQTVLPVMGTAHSTGFPSYTIVGWIASVLLQPFGSPAYRVDLLAAIFAAVAVACTVSVSRQLGTPRLIALAAGIAMAAGLLFWRNATHADPHMFHVALLGLLLVLLVGWGARRRSDDPAMNAVADRWLIAATVVYGIAVGNHGLSLLLAPGIALYVFLVEPRILLRWHQTRLHVPWGIAATCVVLLAATIAIVYAELPIRAAMGAKLVYGRPDTWDGFWYVVLAQQFHGLVSDPFVDMGPKSFAALDFMTPQLGWALYVLPLGYFAALWRQPTRAIVAGLALVTGWMLLAPDQFANAIAQNDALPFTLPLGLAAVLALHPRFGALTGVWFVVTCWFSMSYDDGVVDRYYLGPILIAFTWVALCAGEFVSVAAELLGAPDWTMIGARLPRQIAAFAETLRTPGGMRTSIADDVLRYSGARTASPARGSARAVEERPDAEARQLRAADRRSRRTRSILSTLVPLAAILLIAPQISPIADRHRSPSGNNGGANESNRTGDRMFLNRVMSGLPANAVIISHWSASTTLWYGQAVEGMRPDVFIADDRTLLDIGLEDDIPRSIDFFTAKGRPVFVIRLTGDLERLKQTYRLQPSSFDPGVYKVIGPLE